MWKKGGKIMKTFNQKQSFLTTGILSFQHVLAMFGATVLVPFITGLNPSIALMGAGVGTLIFHLITGGKGTGVFRFFLCFYCRYFGR